MIRDPGRGAGHVCLAFDNRADLEARAREFLAAGAATGELTRYIAAEEPTVPLPWLPLGDRYPEGVVIDPHAQVAVYAAATEDAVATGYTGLRVVADVTSLVRTPEQRDAFARYEYLIDRYIPDHPYTAICAYDRADLGDAAIAELACMHSRADARVPFQLHACPPAEGSAALTGELDLHAYDLLTTTLDRADLPPADEVVLQASGLRFADHGALLRIERYADDRGITVVLRDANGGVKRLADMLGLSRLRVEAAR
ncbi:MEDS domain-containing protein [Actinoplanes sp. NBRC 103695]|uniref:MEDS domain-containing protein n=1 Tax=Actinoplanes sp. NBRC 103695 TaxID=3032202 RepID=UPI0025576523|nr:MEDS domain-containing protein [Actinoplanes sp. NBRC 103695]